MCASVTKDAKGYNPVKTIQLKLYTAVRDNVLSLSHLRTVNTSAEGLECILCLQGEKIGREGYSD